LWNNHGDEAALILEETIDKETLEKERQLLLAMAQRMICDFAKAISLLTPLHQENPAQFTIANQLALVMIESNDEALRSRANQIAEANVRNAPNSNEAWATLGWIQYRLGDLNASRQSFQRGIAGGVISRDTAWHMSQLQQKMGQQAEADRLLESAMSSNGPFFSRCLSLKQ